jgi:4-hydroxybenzoate polyprenyltransferase
MRKERKILLLSVGCIILSLPLSYLVNVYGLFDFILFIPLLLMFVVIAYSAFEIKKLVTNNQKEDAANLALGLMVITLIVFIILALSFSLREPNNALYPFSWF